MSVAQLLNKADTQIEIWIPVGGFVSPFICYRLRICLCKGRHNQTFGTCSQQKTMTNSGNRGKNYMAKINPIYIL